MRHWYPIVALLAFAAACADATSPELHATVTVSRDTIVATREVAGSSDWLRFTVPASIHNAGRRPIRYEFCSYAIEELNGSEGRTVWSPVCATMATMPTVIHPGETFELSVDVFAVAAGAGPSWRSNHTTGTYRLSLWLLPEGHTGVMPSVGSNTFVLVDR
jgi:hypothetical protein